MLSVKTQSGWLPITVATNAYHEKDEEGEETLTFDIPSDSDIFTYLKTEAEIRTDDNLFLIKGVNKLITRATISCQLNMDEWKASYYLKPEEDEHLQTKTIGDALNYIKPNEWTIKGASVRTIKRTLDLEKCTSYELLMRAKTIYDVQYDIDTLHKTITIIDPYLTADTGLYVTPELNMKDQTYKEGSTGIITRLYCYGADDLTFAEINDGKPYIDLLGYKGKPIIGSWTDGRYTNMQSLLEDGRKKLQEISVPVASYTVNMVDLAAIDKKYRNLKVKIRETAHCIVDPVRGIEVPHRIVKIRKYLLEEDKEKNIITLSNQPRKLEKLLSALKENVQTVQKDGMRYETEVKQTNKEITELAKKTDENTKDIQSVERKLTPEQLLIEVSNSIKKGNKLDVTQVIIGLLGLTIKNGGIRVYDGDGKLVLYVDDKTKKLVMEGEVKAKSGNIGGFTIGQNGLSAEYTEILSDYTENDYLKVRDYILGEITLTNTEIERLDVDHSGYLSSRDYVLIKNMVQGITGTTWKHTFEINAKSPNKFITYTVDRGKNKVEEYAVSLSSIDRDTMSDIHERIAKIETKLGISN